MSRVQFSLNLQLESFIRAFVVETKRKEVENPSARTLSACESAYVCVRVNQHKSLIKAKNNAFRSLLAYRKLPSVKLYLLITNWWRCGKFLLQFSLSLVWLKQWIKFIWNELRNWFNLSQPLQRFPSHSFLMLLFDSLFLKIIVENKDIYLRLVVGKGGKTQCGFVKWENIYKSKITHFLVKRSKLIKILFNCLSTPVNPFVAFTRFQVHFLSSWVLCEERFVGEK